MLAEVYALVGQEPLAILWGHGSPIRGIDMRRADVPDVHVSWTLFVGVNVASIDSHLLDALSFEKGKDTFECLEEVPSAHRCGEAVSDLLQGRVVVTGGQVPRRAIGSRD